MAADDPATTGAGALAAMLLTKFPVYSLSRCVAGCEAEAMSTKAGRNAEINQPSR